MNAEKKDLTRVSSYTFCSQRLQIYNPLVARTYPLAPLSQSMARNGPEDHREGRHERRCEEGDPNRTAQQEFVNVRLADPECAKRGSL